MATISDNNKITTETSRTTALSHLAKACSAEVQPMYPEGERLAPYLECMSKKAKAREGG